MRRWTVCVVPRPKLRTLPIKTATIEHYRQRERREASRAVSCRVSVRRVDDITKALGDARQHGQRAESEDLPRDRELAEPAHRRECCGPFQHLHSYGVHLHSLVYRQGDPY